MHFILLFSILISFSSQASDDFCKLIDNSFLKYNWGISNCKDYNFKTYNKSFNNTDIVFTEIGDSQLETVIIMCGVHGDEITPIKFCFDVLKNKESYKKYRIVIAPLVAPDSFFSEKPSRTNANGVDVNRNLPTKDWDKFALKKWKHNHKEDKRRYPGPYANSEIETKFQVYLIEKFKPKMIISVHSPLTLFDYDGPQIDTMGETHFGPMLLDIMSKKSKNYQVKDYPYYPGSLGNYAGYERKIPTFTLELPSSDYTKHQVYWDMFKDAINFALNNDISKSK
jgi:protein MpaA